MKLDTSLFSIKSFLNILRCDSTMDKLFALHAVNPGLIPSTAYYSLPGVIQEHYQEWPKTETKMAFFSMLVNKDKQWSPFWRCGGQVSL